MDQKKIGEFLRELRKEKGLTQAQMAEHFNIAGRTVSRWETGANMPDISIIPEIAEFFEVDIKEIMNGERAKAEADQPDTVSAVIEYADADIKQLLRKLSIYSIAGLAAMALYVIMTELGDDQDLFLSMAEGLSLMLVYVALSQNLLFTTGRMEKQLERRRGQNVKVILLRTLLAVGAVIFIAALIAALLVKGA